MRDVLEERLATHLHTLGETVADELPLPVDLELQVVRRRRRARAKRRWSSVGVAAAIIAAVSVVAIAHGTTGRGSLRIATSSTTPAPVHDALQPGTVMLAARGRYVISLDERGHTNATMVQAEHGDITYARATADHRALWYLSLKKGSKACGDVVRADIDGRASKIVTNAVAFDVSPDGSRLALYGAGDLAHDHCSPVTAGVQGRIVVFDLASRSSSALTVGSVTSMRWSPDGSYLLSVSCSRVGCAGWKRIDVPKELGGRLVAAPGRSGTTPARPLRALSAEFAPDGLYALAETARPRNPSVVAVTIDRYDTSTLRTVTPVYAGSGWEVSQLIPTTTGTYVVATPAPSNPEQLPKSATAGLYRIRAGRLVLVRTLTDPGTLTPVAPIVVSP